MVSEPGELSRALARALREPEAPPQAAIADPLSFVAEASHHRVLLVLGWRLRVSGTLAQWPRAFVDAFHDAEHNAIASDIVRQRELTEVLGAWQAADVRALLFKGAAIAYTRYPAPHLRVRADTDVLIPEDDLSRVEHVLDGLGYVHPAETSGHLVSYQSHYEKADRYGVLHALDVHWQVSNVQSLAHRISHSDLWARRVPLPALGSSASAVDAVSAVLLALVHRAGHHPGSRNLLWLYDLHLLTESLAHRQLRQLVDVAAARGLIGIAVEGLTLARDAYGGEAIGLLLDTLRATARRPDEAPVVDAFTQAGLLRLDLAALPTWRARARLLREHVLPPPSYMRARYGIRSSAFLPALYLWRLAHGVPRWLAPRPRQT